jgi:endoribonuclease Dicer
VNQKGVALLTSSVTTRRAKRESLQQKQILVPELCDVHPFPASLWRKAVCIPAMLYRTNCLLIAEELRARIAREAHIGSTVCLNNFPPLKFDYCALTAGHTESRDVRSQSADTQSSEERVDASVNHNADSDLTNPQADVCSSSNCDTSDSKQTAEAAAELVKCCTCSGTDGCVCTVGQLERFVAHDTSEAVTQLSNANGLLRHLDASQGAHGNSTTAANVCLPSDCAAVDEHCFETDSAKNNRLLCVHNNENKLSGLDQIGGENCCSENDANKTNVALTESRGKTLSSAAINDVCRRFNAFSLDADTTSDGGPSPCDIIQTLTMSNANDFFNLERLETIGDSFLKFAVTIYLYCTYPRIHEGKLSYLRSLQVCVV